MKQNLVIEVKREGSLDLNLDFLLGELNCDPRSENELNNSKDSEDNVFSERKYTARQRINEMVKFYKDQVSKAVEEFSHQVLEYERNQSAVKKSQLYSNMKSLATCLNVEIPSEESAKSINVLFAQRKRIEETILPYILANRDNINKLLEKKHLRELPKYETKGNPGPDYYFDENGAHYVENYNEREKPYLTLKKDGRTTILEIHYGFDMHVQRQDTSEMWLYSLRTLKNIVACAGETEESTKKEKMETAFALLESAFEYVQKEKELNNALEERIQREIKGPLERWLELINGTLREKIGSPYTKEDYSVQNDMNYNQNSLNGIINFITTGIQNPEQGTYNIRITYSIHQ